ncbi:MAG: hypothetical protein ACHQXA_08920 [Gemmatimonadales bacterium]
METGYALALFLHILGVFALLGGMGVIALSEAKLGEAGTVAELQGWAALAMRTGVTLGVAALVLLVSGMYMAHSRWGVMTPWVFGALLGLLFFALSGPLVAAPRILAAVREAVAAGSVSDGIRRRFHAPALRWLNSLRPAFLVWFAFLMTMKPGLTGTIVSAAVALVVGAGVALLRKRGG